jgi:hypothetical protein
MRNWFKTLAITISICCCLGEGLAEPPATPHSAELPLLHKDNLKYIGQFRLPGGSQGASAFDYGGTALAFNPANNSLFVVGHDWKQHVAEVAIPDSIVNSNNLGRLTTAKVLQPLCDVLSRVPNNSLAGRTVKIGGLLVVEGELLGTAFDFYDGGGTAKTSHFKLDSLNLATAKVDGFFPVGKRGAGFVAGYMAPIPAEWQEALGAPYLTGQAALCVISRTSAGPAAFGFDPRGLGLGVIPVIPYVYYPISRPLAPLDRINPLFTMTTEIKGVFFAPHTRSVLFFGANGTNAIGYGDAATFNDKNRTAKGPHSRNGDYAYEVWAYDVNDFIAVRNGRKRPWEIKPYETWYFDLPIFEGAKHVGGVAFDPANRRLYVSQLGGEHQGDSYMPLIQVYQQS